MAFLISEILTVKKKTYSDLARQINNTKVDIDNSRMKLDKLKEDREATGLNFSFLPTDFPCPFHSTPWKSHTFSFLYVKSPLVGFQEAAYLIKNLKTIVLQTVKWDENNCDYELLTINCPPLGNLTHVKSPSQST